MTYLILGLIIVVLCCIIYFTWKNNERRLNEINDKYQADIIRITSKVADLKNQSKEVNDKIREIVNETSTLDNDTVKHLLDDIKF